MKNNMKISNVLVCGCKKPIALTDKELIFSFSLEFNNNDNTNYQLLIYSSREDLLKNKHCIYKSSKLDFKKDNTIKVESSLFNRGNDYFYCIKFKSISYTGTFGIGLLIDDFKARWIERETISDIAPLFLKSFTLNFKCIKKAYLYISGLGYFKAFLNSSKVGNDSYVPQVSDYMDRPLDGCFETTPIGTRKSTYYLCYDVKELLNKNNTLAVLVGNGWFKNKEKPNEGNFYYGEPRCFFELRIEYLNGKKQVIYSDKYTYTANSNMLKNTLYTGEIIDFRIPLKLLINQYKDKELSLSKELRDLPGEFLYQKEPSDRYGEIFKGYLIKKEGLISLYDFKQNHSGDIDIILVGKKGCHVTFTYGENITKDKKIDVYSSSWGGHIQKDEIYLSGEKDHYSCSFTIHGFRYVEIVSSEPIEILNIQSKFIYSFVDFDGDFNSDNEIINTIFRNYRYTQLSNLHGNVPTDCPHRERRGFLGDGHASMISAMYCFDMRLSYKKWIKDIKDAQSMTGYMPHTAPFAAGGGGPGFGSGCIIIPYYYYNFYGDIFVLENSYDNMINWIKYLNTRHDGDGLIIREEKGWCIGEWFNPTLINLSIPFANTYFFILSIKLVIEISNILGKTLELNWLNALLNFEIKVFLKKYYDKKTHRFCEGGKGACFFGLDLEILSEEETRLCLEDGIKHIVNDLDYHLETGIFGTPLMFKILTKYNRRDILEKIISQETYPGYGYMIKKGATTLWEGFEERDGPSYLLRDNYPQTGYGVSHNHPMLGSVCEYFFRFFAGLDINTLGVTREININPYLTGKMKKAFAKKETIFGLASCSFIKENKNVRIEVTIPCSCKGILKLDDLKNITINDEDIKSLVLDSGKYIIKGELR